MKRAFTLIELLVVIAIIAILAAILFPVFARARDAARGAACQSNQKQIALGFGMYVQDYDEVYPIYFYTVSGVNFAWPGAINPYTKNGQIFRCPNDPNQSNGYDGTSGDISVSYGFNDDFLSGSALAGINKPAETVLTGDNGDFGACCNGSNASTPPSTPPIPNPSTPDGMTARHSGNDRVIVSYADGHVKSQKLDFLFTMQNNEDGATGLTGFNQYIYWNRL